MAQWEFVDWLLFWILETSDFEFEWDQGNLLKSSVKHGIGTQEIEGIFNSGLALPLGIQVSPLIDEQRLGLVGPGPDGKIFQVAFVIREKRVRVISARHANKKERTRYEEIYREITQRI